MALVADEIWLEKGDNLLISAARRRHEHFAAAFGLDLIETDGNVRTL